MGAVSFIYNYSDIMGLGKLHTGHIVGSNPLIGRVYQNEPLAIWILSYVALQRIYRDTQGQTSGFI